MSDWYSGAVLNTTNTYVRTNLLKQRNTATDNYSGHGCYHAILRESLDWDKLGTTDKEYRLNLKTDLNQFVHSSYEQLIIRTNKTRFLTHQHLLTAYPSFL